MTDRQELERGLAELQRSVRHMTNREVLLRALDALREELRKS